MGAEILNTERVNHVDQNLKKSTAHQVELCVKVGGTNVLKKEHSIEGAANEKKNMQNSF